MGVLDFNPMTPLLHHPSTPPVSTS